MSSEGRPVVGVALTGAEVLDALEHGLSAAIVDNADFVVVGIERVLGPGDASTAAAGTAVDVDRSVDPTIAATVLSQREPSLQIVVAASAHRDHPYNLARRVASVDHVSGGRAGVLLGVRDQLAPGDSAWGGAGLTAGAPLDAATAADAAAALAALWQSWPVDSIVADVERGVFVQAEQIRHVDHRGAFDIDGPLNVPTTPQGAPVLFGLASSVSEAQAFAPVVDVLVLDGVDPADVPSGPSVLVLGVDVVRPSALVDRVVRDGDTLRARLGLRAPAALAPEARRAYPTPVPAREA